MNIFENIFSKLNLPEITPESMDLTWGMLDEEVDTARRSKEQNGNNDIFRALMDFKNPMAYLTPILVVTIVMISLLVMICCISVGVYHYMRRRDDRRDRRDDRRAYLDRRVEEGLRMQDIPLAGLQEPRL